MLCCPRLFGGLLQDIRRKARWYGSDFSDGLHPQCLSAVLYIYLATVTNAITFGGMLGDATANMQVGATVGCPHQLPSAQPAGLHCIHLLPLPREPAVLPGHPEHHPNPASFPSPCVPRALTLHPAVQGGVSSCQLLCHWGEAGTGPPSPLPAWRLPPLPCISGCAGELPGHSLCWLCLLPLFWPAPDHPEQHRSCAGL